MKSAAGDAQAEVPPERWHGINLVGVPVGVLGSAAFNAHPQALHIAGTRETHPGLFALLARCADAAEARAVFEHTMTLAFGLSRDRDGDAAGTERHRWRTSYLKLLQGWGLDANGPAGAVLKGWAESRFGLAPGYHGAPLRHYPSPAWMRYQEHKSASRWHNNNIHQQLDLLFEFCQWMLARFALLGDGDANPPTHATLWRGSHDCEEQIVAGSLRARRCTVRLNNLVSFSLDRDTAGCFGDWVMKARVPLCKLLLVPGLLTTRSLDGESEVLALGGDYEVEVSYAP